VIAKESYRKLRKSSTYAIRQAAARLSPSGGTTFQTTFSPVSFGKIFIKIRSAVPENGCLIFLTDGKKNKKNKKICKTYTHPPPTGRQLRKLPSFYCECHDREKHINSSRCILQCTNAAQKVNVYSTI